MAWYNRWKMEWKSLNGEHYTLYIKTETDGALITLTPAAIPFEIQVDHFDDFEHAVRQTTGTLRFINNGELDSILPTGDMSRKIVCNSQISAFHFEGYLQASLYTQPWDGYPYEVEVPVVGMLSAMQYVTVQDSTDFTPLPFAAYLIEAAAAADVTISAVYIPNDYAAGSTILDRKVKRRWFIDKREENGTTVFEGISWLDAIEKYTAAWGYTVEEWNGRIFFQTRRPHSTIYTYTSAMVQRIANGETVTPDTRTETVLDIEAAFGNMSADNNVSQLQPYKRVLLQQRIEVEDGTMKLDNSYIDWETSLADDTMHLFKGSTTQPGVTLSRKYINSSGVPTSDVPDIVPVCTEYNGSTIAGAVLASLETWTASEGQTKTSLAKPSSNLFLTGGANGQHSGSTTYKSNLIPVAEFLCQDALDEQSQTGALCITGQVALCNSSNGNPSGSEYNPSSDISLLMSIELSEHIYWNGSAWTYDADRTSDPYCFPVTFGTDGQIKTNRSTVTLLKSLTFNDAKGYIMPFDMKTGWTTFGVHQPKFTIYSPFQLAPNVFVILKNVNVSFTGVIEPNTLPTEHTYVLPTGSAYGEDMEMSVDSWNPTFNFSPWCNQPNLPWNSDFAYELTHPRNLIVLDDAVQVATARSAAFYPFRLLTFGGLKYYCIGRSFNTSTDSGEVYLLQYRNLYES